MQTPDKVSALWLEATCTSVSMEQWKRLMDGAKRANKKTIDRLVKKHLPDLYEQLALNYYNPYNYFMTDKHLILVHSGIEYFLRYEKLENSTYTR